MTRKSTSWKTESSQQEVVAGIVGSGRWVSILAQVLKEKGCTVFISKTLSSLSSNLTYLFIHQDFESSFSLFSKNKFLQTSILFILPDTTFSVSSRLETQVQSSPKKNIRLLKIGNVSAWDERALCDLSIWAMFTPQLGRVTDFSKELIDNRDHTKRMKRSSFLKPRMLQISKRMFQACLFFFILLSPLFFLLSLFFFTSYSMYNVFVPLSRGNFKSAEDNLSRFQDTVHFQNSLSSLPDSLVGVPIHSSVQRYVLFFDHSLTFAEDLIEFKSVLFTFRHTYEANTGEIGKDDLESLKNHLSRTISSGEVFLRDLQFVPVPFDTSEYTQKLERLLHALRFSNEVFPFAEQVLLKKGESDYLVLFQNNTELRPTGGFIGSYALLRVKDGRVLSYTFHDVYEADGQLKAHVDPPQAIRDYLEQPNWFLRDSNFDPDFSASAQQAMWFLEQETGEKVDGVIGINLNVVSRILGVIGDVYLPDYREEVTSENFLLKATSESQQEFFPGSTAKRDFLRSLASSISYALLESQSVDYFSLVSAFQDSLDRKDILLYSTDPQLQMRIEDRGWGGRLVDVSCSISNCIPDFFMLVDANLGVNKANLYVSRRIAIKKDFDDSGNLNSAVSVIYSNESPSQVFPSGSYKNYMRFYLPSDVIVRDILVDKTSALSSAFVSIYGNDKREIGLLVEVFPQSEKKVEILYSQKFSLSAKSYEFFLSKQPGEREGSIDLEFHEGDQLRLTPKNFEPIYSDNIFSYTTDSSVDRIFVFDILK